MKLVAGDDYGTRSPKVVVGNMSILADKNKDNSINAFNVTIGGKTKTFKVRRGSVLQAYRNVRDYVNDNYEDIDVTQ